jgi:hypothetical protein
MRVLALVVVFLGCLGLGRYGWRSLHPESAPPAAVEVSPAAAGIAVVGGLLLLVTGTRRPAPRRGSPTS